jgi:hypothetical protein
MCDYNVSATHIFTKHTFRAAESTPLSLSPTVLCKGWGNTGCFQLQAVALVWF